MKHHYIYVNEKELIVPDDEVHVIVHYLVGYCPQTITAYQEMAKHLRESFPEAKDCDIKCHRVHKSSYVQSFTMIAWSGRVKKSRIGLPNAKEYKNMVQLPDWGEWFITQRNCESTIRS